MALCQLFPSDRERRGPRSVWDIHVLCVASEVKANNGVNFCSNKLSCGMHRYMEITTIFTSALLTSLANLGYLGYSKLVNLKAIVTYAMDSS